MIAYTCTLDYVFASLVNRYGLQYTCLLVDYLLYFAIVLLRMCHGVHYHYVPILLEHPLYIHSITFMPVDAISLRFIHRPAAALLIPLPLPCWCLLLLPRICSNCATLLVPFPFCSGCSAGEV